MRVSMGRLLPLLALTFQVFAQGHDLNGQPAQAVFKEAEALRLSFEKKAAGQAISRYAEVRDYWLQVDDVANAALAAGRIGATREQLGNLEGAIQSYAEAVALAQGADDKHLLSNLESALGMAMAYLGSTEVAWDAAERHCFEARSRAEASNAVEARALALNCTGEVLYARGLPAEAVVQYAEAVEALQAVHAPLTRAQSLLFLGYAHSDLSEFESAGEAFDAALTLWRELNNDRGEALTLAAVGRMYQRQSEYQNAFTHFFDAKEKFERIGDVVNLASSLEGIAAVYMDMGEYRNAQRFWSQG